MRLFIKSPRNCFHSSSVFGVLHLLVLWFGILTPSINGAPVLNASLIPDDERIYNIRDNFCRLLSHTSLVLTDPVTGGLRIALDGGLAKFKVQIERPLTQNNISTIQKDWEVPDFNGDTAIIDLTTDFSIESVSLQMKLTPRPKINGVYVPLTLRGYMWTNTENSHLYISGGHFYDVPYWNQSVYYVNKVNIPDYSLWRFDIAEHKWDELYPTGDHMIRLSSTAYTSIPQTNLSYAFGGYVSDLSVRDVPENHSWATNGMVVYDHSTNSVINITESPANNHGYTQGNLHHIGPFQDHRGLLINVMAKQFALSEVFQDANETQGESFDFTTIRFFDLERNVWYEQKADFVNGDVPGQRTRFCSVLVRDKEAGTWDLWLYGGMNAIGEANSADTWVLTMPAFMWVKIPNSFEEVEVRGHSCHAVGSQMLVLGGYPRVARADPTAICAPNLLRVFDMNNMSWVNKYKKDTVYRQPDPVRHWAKNTPAAGWGNPVLKSLITSAPLETETSQTIANDPQKSKGLTTSDKIGIALGTFGGVAVIGGLIYWFLSTRRKRAEASNENNRSRSLSASYPAPPYEGFVMEKAELDNNVAAARPQNYVPESRIQEVPTEPVFELRSASTWNEEDRKRSSTTGIEPTKERSISPPVDPVSPVSPVSPPLASSLFPGLPEYLDEEGKPS